MRRNPLWLVLFCLLMRVSGAQTPLPATTYKLHAEKEQNSRKRPTGGVYLLPDQALLVLIPQSDDKWHLKRISSWDTATPREETLSVVGEPLDEAGWPDIMVDPAGNYAVIRLPSSSRGSSLVVGARSAVVVLVDLFKFIVISRQITNDPLLAAGSWSFSRDGLLIAKAMTDRIKVPLHPKPEWKYDTLTDTYESGAFALPTWKLSMTCRYEEVFDRAKATQKVERQLGKVDASCADLVELAGVPSVTNLPSGPHKPSPYAALAGPTCGPAGESVAGKQLYACRTGNTYFDGEIVTTTSRDLTVLAVPSGKLLLRVPLPHNYKPFPAVLANAGGHTWLLLLREGINLETYRIP